MLGRLPVALAQVQASNTSEILLNQLYQLLCFLYRIKETTDGSYFVSDTQDHLEYIFKNREKS